MSELADAILVECRCCHRSERWSAVGRTVELEGGHRQPSRNPQLEAWRTLNQSLAGEIGRIVGSCSACGQPLVSDAPSASIFDWTFRLNDGDYTVAQDIQGPNGLVEPDAFHQQMMDAFYEEEEFEPAQTLFSMTVLMLMTAPIILWVLAGITVAMILLNYSSSTQVFVPSF